MINSLPPELGSAGIPARDASRAGQKSRNISISRSEYQEQLTCQSTGCWQVKRFTHCKILPSPSSPPLWQAYQLVSKTQATFEFDCSKLQIFCVSYVCTKNLFSFAFLFCAYPGALALPSPFPPFPLSPSPSAAGWQIFSRHVAVMKLVLV